MSEYPSTLLSVNVGDRRGLSIPVRNVGPGVAVIANPLPMISEEWRDEASHTQGAVSRSVIPPGESGRLNFGLWENAAGALFNEAYVEVTYTDIGGQQRQRTIFFLRRDANYVFEIRGVAFFDGDGRHPSSGQGEGFDWAMLAAPDV